MITHNDWYTDEEGNAVLLHPGRRVPVGGRLF